MFTSERPVVNVWCVYICVPDFDMLFRLCLTGIFLPEEQSYDFDGFGAMLIFKVTLELDKEISKCGRMQSFPA